MSDTARAPLQFEEPDLSGFDAARVPLAAPGTLGEKIGRAFEAGRYLDSQYGQEQLLIEEYDQRIQDIARVSGQRLDNPYTLNRDDEDADEAQQGRLYRGGVRDARRRTIARHRARFEEEVTRLRNQYPDLIDAAGFDAQVQQRAQDLEYGVQGAGLPGFVGAVGAGFTDPVTLSTLPLGWGGRTILGTALREAAVNSGVEALMQPGIQEGRAELGLEAGLGQGVSNIVAAGVFGGVFGGGAKGVEQLLTRGSRRELVEAVDSLPDEIAQDPEVQAAAAELEKEATTDEAAGQDEADIEAQALHGETVTLADEVAAEEGVLPEMFPEEPGAAAPREEATRNYTGVSGIEFFNPDELLVDAERFQFKSGGDSKGVTDALTSVRTWDDALSGNILVWEDLNGQVFVVNGHQRSGLARRLISEGQEVPPLRGFRLREADGINAAEARAVGARINIAEGTGAAVDVAKVFRERPDLLQDGTLSPRTQAFRDGRDMRKLSDEAFMVVVNDVVTPQQGALVARLVTNPGEQMAVMSLLARQKPDTRAEAEALVREALAAGFAREEQVGLFGTEDVTESLIVDRAKILGGAVNKIRRDKRLFSALDKGADDVEAAGNKLDREKNKELADNANQIADIILRTAHTTGPVADALRRAVQSVQSGATRAAATRTFIDELTALGPDALRGLDGAGGSSGGAGRAAGAAGPDRAPAGEGAGLSGQSDVAADAGSRFDRPAEGAEEQLAALEAELYDNQPPSPVAQDNLLLTGMVADEEGQLQPVTQTRQALAEEIEAEEQMLARFEGCAYPKKGSS